MGEAVKALLMFFVVVVVVVRDKYLYFRGYPSGDVHAISPKQMFVFFSMHHFVEVDLDDLISVVSSLVVGSMGAMKHLFSK
jgi:hypothetical protein